MLQCDGNDKQHGAASGLEREKIRGQRTRMVIFFVSAPDVLMGRRSPIAMSSPRHLARVPAAPRLPEPC